MLCNCISSRKRMLAHGQKRWRNESKILCKGNISSFKKATVVILVLWYLVFWEMFRRYHFVIFGTLDSAPGPSTIWFLKFVKVIENRFNLRKKVTKVISKQWYHCREWRNSKSVLVWRNISCKYVFSFFFWCIVMVYIIWLKKYFWKSLNTKYTCK